MFQTSKLIITSKSRLPLYPLCKNNVVHEFSCCMSKLINNKKNAALTSYIGHTCSALSRRLTCHLSKQSAIRAHIK